MDSLPSLHEAIAVQGLRQPLASVQVPTKAPGQGEVVVRVEWSSIGPYHVHQNDGGLVINSYPYILGDTFAGTVVALGPGPHAVADLAVGDDVLGYSFRNDGDGKEAGLQEYITVPSFLLGRMPANLSMESAVTTPDNLICVFQTVVKNLGLLLPWPLPAGFTPPEADAPIILWGGAGSVGMYTIQVLHLWGYRHVIAVARGKHHEYLRQLGANYCFDYQAHDVLEQIGRHLGGESVPYAIDCIGNTETMRPLAQLTGKGSKVAVMLPVIAKSPTETSAPEYIMTPPGELSEVPWKEGVEVSGVRTHFYLEV